MPVDNQIKGKVYVLVSEMEKGLNIYAVCKLRMVGLLLLEGHRHVGNTKCCKNWMILRGRMTVLGVGNERSRGGE